MCSFRRPAIAVSFGRPHLFSGGGVNSQRPLGGQISTTVTSPTRITDAKKLKENPDLAELELPGSDKERAGIIETEQFTGRSCHNEMLARQAATLVRALVRASRYYADGQYDIDHVVPFQPRPEDVHFSIFRPALDQTAA